MVDGGLWMENNRELGFNYTLMKWELGKDAIIPIPIPDSHFLFTIQANEVSVFTRVRILYLLLYNLRILSSS